MPEHDGVGDLIPGELGHPAEVLTDDLGVDRIRLGVRGQLVGGRGEVREVGADRIANAVGAYDLYGGPNDDGYYRGDDRGDCRMGERITRDPYGREYSEDVMMCRGRDGVWREE